jgi:hypothetical protein
MARLLLAVTLIAGLGCGDDKPKVEINAPGVNIKAGPGGAEIKAPGVDIKAKKD